MIFIAQIIKFDLKFIVVLIRSQNNLNKKMNDKQEKGQNHQSNSNIQSNLEFKQVINQNQNKHKQIINIFAQNKIIDDYLHSMQNISKLNSQKDTITQKQYAKSAQINNILQKSDQNLANKVNKGCQYKQLLIICVLLILMTILLWSTNLVMNYFCEQYLIDSKKEINERNSQQLDNMNMISNNIRVQYEKDRQIKQKQQKVIDINNEQNSILANKQQNNQHQNTYKELNQILPNNNQELILQYNIIKQQQDQKVIKQQQQSQQTLLIQQQFQSQQQLQSNQQLKQQYNWKLRQYPRQLIPPFNSQHDMYEFQQSANQLVQKSSLKIQYNDSPWLKSQIQYTVGPKQHQRAIRLLQLTHNINFKGQFIFDHYNHYKSPQQKYQTLKTLLDQQKYYYQQKYSISKYIHNQLKFCVFVTSFNNANNRIYLRNLDSIFQQQYNHYHLVYVDDKSTDRTAQYVQKYMIENQIPPDKYTIIKNQQNQGNTHNTYMVAHQICQQGQIMALVDGDDALIGRQVFSLLNAFYQKEKPALVYTQLLFIYPTHVGNSRNQPIDTAIFQKTGDFRRQFVFCTSHLKTFYVDLFRMIKTQDLQFENEEWIPHSPDVAYMTPMLQMAGSRIKFLTQITYEYRHDTNFNQPAQGFREVNPKIFAKKPYSLVKDLPFADNLITKSYP